MVETVRVEKLARDFKVKGGSNRVLAGLSFSLKAGQVLIVTGRNGSGKTTLLKILAGLLSPDSGRVLLKGVDALKDTEKAKKLVGFVGSEERALYWKLTGRQNLEFFASIYGIDSKTIADRVEQLAKRLELAEFLDRPVEDCSLGMKQRLAIARCLISHPEILLFDEPLKGLDKAAKRKFIEILSVLRKKGYTVIIATHNIEDFKPVKYRKLELSR